MIKQFGKPMALVTDKAPSLICVLNKLISDDLFNTTDHRTNKYLNNLIEQDHCPIKKGMETIHAL